MIRAAVFAAASVAGAAAIGLMPVEAAAQQDWAKQVVVTPEGGYRMGNPDAAVKVVEYGSLTCPHCADFINSAKVPIAAGSASRSATSC